MRRTQIIAEAGVNHNGSLERALAMVDAAAAARADFCKFQTFRAERLASPLASMAPYQQPAAPGSSQLEMLRALELTETDHLSLIDRCRANDISFLSTPFDQGSAQMLGRLGLVTFKVSSGELTNLPLLRLLGGLGRKWIVSTGMSTLSQIEQALKALEQGGAHQQGIVLLQCTTQYPTPYEDIHLAAMDTLRREFGVAVGLSDHSEGVEVALAAVALGAVIIEKHFTLDKSLPGPDHKASVLPHELAQMIRGIRRVEQAIGSPEKRVLEGERPNEVAARKSLHLTRSLPKGNQLEADDLQLMRPGDGLPASALTELSGFRLVQDLPSGHKLQWSDLVR